MSLIWGIHPEPLLLINTPLWRTSLWLTHTHTQFKRVCITKTISIIANPTRSRKRLVKPPLTAHIADIILRLHVFTVMALPNRWSSLILPRAETKRNRCKHLSGLVLLVLVPDVLVKPSHNRDTFSIVWATWWFSSVSQGAGPNRWSKT